MPLPDPPNPHALFILLFTIFSLWLLTRNYIKLELSSLIILVALLILFSVFPFPIAEATALSPLIFFKNFGHEAVIAVCSLMVIGEAIVRTGALEPVGQFLSKIWGESPNLSFLFTLILAAICSAFVNNMPIVIMLLPVLINVCISNKISSSKILLPVSFATLVGGMTTTIGTSTNILVVSVAADLGLDRFNIFDFAIPALCAASVAMLYLWLIAPKLLPDRDITLTDFSPRLFEARLLLNKTIAPLTLSEAVTLTNNKMQIIRIEREEQLLLPLPDIELQANDKLHVLDTPTNLKAYESQLSATLYSGEDIVDEEHPLRSNNQQLTEVLISEGSLLHGTTLRFTQFLDRFHLAVLALHRSGKQIWRPREGIAEVVLQTGDILLVQGAKKQITEIKNSNHFVVLDAGTEILVANQKSTIALLTVAFVVFLAATETTSIAISALTGALILLATNCLHIDQATRSISPAIYLLVVASLSLGDALQNTGATKYLTDLFLYTTYGASPPIILASLMLLLIVLTNIISNNAAAVIGTPFAIGIANELGLPPEPFVLAVLFGANMSYATPFAYKTNLLVMNAGNYTFSDFLRVGLPLALIMWILLSCILTYIYF